MMLVTCFEDEKVALSCAISAKWASGSERFDLIMYAHHFE